MEECESCKNTVTNYKILYINEVSIYVCEKCIKIRNAIWPSEYLCYNEKNDNENKKNMLDKMDNNMKKLFSDKFYFKITYKIFELSHDGYCSDNDDSWCESNILPKHYNKTEHNITLSKPILNSLPIKKKYKINFNESCDESSDEFSNDYEIDFNIINGDDGLYQYLSGHNEFGAFYSIPRDGSHYCCGCDKRTFNITKLEIHPVK
jgi:hypothetical protein